MCLGKNEVSRGCNRKLPPAPLREGGEGFILLSQIFVSRHFYRKSVLSVALYPFSLIYLFFIVLRRYIYTIIPKIAFKSKIKIISIGNLTTGGTGKTPFTICLARNLIKQGKKIAIVLRGYKSNYEKDNIILYSDNNSEYHGDESSLYLRQLPDIPIGIGKNRVQSIKLLEEAHPDLDYIIMDDGFQHLRVYQDVKICLFNSVSPIGNGFCLPAGILREPLHCVKYSDMILISGNTKNIPESFLTELSKFDKDIFYGDYEISFIKDLSGNIFSGNFHNKQVMLLSGIGTPSSFENTISKAKIEYHNHMALPDHFNYTQAFIDSNFESLSKYDYILTTEKDYTKLSQLKINLPILVVYVEYKIPELVFNNFVNRDD